ncbi:MAG: two-component sensor histidine kinase [Actinomycetia bacterium]|nr:two-component sensor histidine kinase [Actinomycetes bacterium]
MVGSDDLGKQLDSLHAISVEIAALHDISDINKRALHYCLSLTSSEYAFTGLLVDGPRVMDVAAVEGFEPVDESFYALFHLMAVRSSVVGVTIREGRPYISNDVLHDPHTVGQPPGHPPVRKFLGVPLLVGTRMIGMIGVANKTDGYGARDERLLETFANQVAVAIENARLYERQQNMIASLQQLHARLGEAERTQLLVRERERIAAGLHDHIEQEVFAIGISITSLLEGNEFDPLVAEQLRAIRQLAVQAADEVRRVVFALAVAEHGDGNLVSEVRSRLRDLERRSDLKTHLVVRGAASSGLETIRDVISSVISEALNNVERHAHARMVLVSLRHGDHHVDVVIQDDGVGASDLVLTTYQDSYLHFGLRHMRQQIFDLGGTFDVSNGEETGTIVRVSVPLPPDAT